MELTDHDIKQIDEKYLSGLTPAQLVKLSEKLLADLRVARDRLNQNTTNSSRPSGSQAPWEASGSRGAKPAESGEGDVAETAGTEGKPTKPEQVMAAAKPSGSQRKPGKQPGAKGAGRRVAMCVTGVVEHKAAECRGCGVRFAEATPFVATTGKYVLDIEKCEQALAVTHVKHLYGSGHAIVGMSRKRCRSVVRQKKGGRWP